MITQNQNCVYQISDYDLGLGGRRHWRGCRGVQGVGRGSGRRRGVWKGVQGGEKEKGMEDEI